ncbi:MAG: hypothetical protein ACJ790_10785 [Myxococcaceae bacterium]
MVNGWARALAERIWRAEQQLQQAQRNLRNGTDEARLDYGRALREMEESQRLLQLACAVQEHEDGMLSAESVLAS